ncbi:MAG: ATP-binding protein [Deltaproteobacteria bacterium]|nr:ATP-binding protein [Deltaproteobacteria bacterium]
MTQPIMPAWATELRARYLAGEASLFLVHGNVRDLVPWTDPATGATTWVDTRAFLERFLERTRDIVAYYNVSQGLSFTSKLHRKLFQTVIDARRQLRGEPKLAELPVTAAAAIPVVEDLITNPSHSAGVILDFFETIAPNGDLSFLAHDDKANLVSLQRWSSDPAFLSTDNLAILVTEHLSDVSRRIVASPQLAVLRVPFPDEATRLAFVRSSDLTSVQMEMTPERFAGVTAGLSLLQIRAMLRGAALNGDRITFNTVNTRKKAIIEQECHGLVELVAPEHNFEHVGGMEGVKADLRRVAEAVKRGNRNRVPMGMIFVGAMGTGKTYIAEAFAAESGLTCLKLKNFRDRWVGSTEANLEKVLELVDALGYVLLIIDEADRGLSAGESSDGGVNSRVIARLKEYMSDTDHRGRVVILMMTNRPDKLDTDLKRPGRFDLKIPFFFPETDDEREGIFRANAKKNRLILGEDVDLADAARRSAGYSAAEIEAVLLSAAAAAGEAETDIVRGEHLSAALADAIPSRDQRMLAFMELLAVFESSSRKMLPERYQQLTTDQVQAQLDELRLALGRRAAL